MRRVSEAADGNDGYRCHVSDAADADRFVACGRFQGSQSCASATCHGGAVGRGPAWNSSFSLSRSADPHATAGLRLYDADSQRIVSLLAPDVFAPAQQGEIEPAQQGVMDPVKYAGVLRQRCISCHTSASASEVMVSGELTPQLVSDGVSCKSCHGSADRWLTEHVKVSWQGTKRFEPATGMRDTESIVGRAETCVRCHVGSRSSDGLIRDMNHDLIAAGHPALRFDLWIYNQNLPHHWASDSGVEKHFEESVLRVREIGRRVAAAAAADLSAERAQDSMVVSGATTGLTAEAAVPWPELSDFQLLCLSPIAQATDLSKVVSPSRRVNQTYSFDRLTVVECLVHRTKPRGPCSIEKFGSPSWQSTVMGRFNESTRRWVSQFDCLPGDSAIGSPGTRNRHQAVACHDDETTRLA